MEYSISPSFRKIPLLTVAALVCMSAVMSASASTISLPVDAYRVIADSTGESRILIKFGGLDSLEGKKILYAKCEFTLNSNSCADTLAHIEIRPLATNWSPSEVNWQSTSESFPEMS